MSRHLTQSYCDKHVTNVKEEKDSNRRDSFTADKNKKGTQRTFPWTREEDDNLKILVNSFGEKNWKIIGSLFPGRTKIQCMNRWKSHHSPDSVKEHKVGSECPSQQMENRKVKKTLLPNASERDVSTPSPSLPAGSASSPTSGSASSPTSGSASNPTSGSASSPTSGSASNPTSGSASNPSPTCGSAKSSSTQEEQKRFADAALRMVAEEMLPLSFVEGVGFRSFMSSVGPQYNKLSTRTISTLLYEDVERTFKPQLIRDLKALSKTQGGGGCIHVTFDLWLSDQTQLAQDPVVVVQLHFVSDSWQIRRPVVAFRRLKHRDLNAAMSRELEAVLLSYGIFPHSIGYVLANSAKQALASNSLFCDYKMMCSSSRGEPDGDELVAFLSDHGCEAQSHFSEVQIGTRATCVAETLQTVINDALKSSRVVENLLSQVHNVVGFFKNSTYWSQVLLKEYNVSLYPPISSCRWNSTMISLRRIVQQWSSIMTLLAQARTEANDIASSPPLVMAKCEQVMDILGLLQPFEEALQVLQGNGVTISSIVPSLVGLDKTLENHSTNYAHFSTALRRGLCTHFQSLIHQKDLILAAVLDPRMKLQLFADVKAEDQGTFLTPPTEQEVRSIVHKALEDLDRDTLPGPAVTPERTRTTTEVKEENKVEAGEVEDRCNDLKRKSIFTLIQPPAEKKTVSEFDVYLTESAWESNCGIYMYWKSAHRFPKLQRLAKRLLAVPATSGGFDRLCPMAACMVRAQRNCLPVHTTERLLLYKYSIKNSSGKRPRPGAKQ